jgi:broad specificity phosphatase PhoE
MKLYFVRHGESTANVLKEFSNSGIKHPLTEHGIAQAHELEKRLHGTAIDQIYSSPVLRAAQTAQILAENLGAPLQITEALREWDVGIYEGTTDPQGWELHRQVQEDWFFQGNYDSKMPGGESFNEIQKRFVPFIEKITHDGQKKDQKIVLVAHGGLYIAMLPVIFKNIDFEFAYQHQFPNTAYSLAEARADGLFCLEWCGIPLNI